MRPMLILFALSLLACGGSPRAEATYETHTSAPDEPVVEGGDEPIED
jgi:hypothetical protein